MCFPKAQDTSQVPLYSSPSISDPIPQCILPAPEGGSKKINPQSMPDKWSSRCNLIVTAEPDCATSTSCGWIEIPFKVGFFLSTPELVTLTGPPVPTAKPTGA